MQSLALQANQLQIDSLFVPEHVHLPEMQLRDQVQEREGAAFSLKDFHRRALDIGGVGLDTLREAVLLTTSPLFSSAARSLSRLDETARGAGVPARTPATRSGGRSSGSTTTTSQRLRFEIEVDGEPTNIQLDEVNKAAEVLLSNPVIENYTVRVEK